MAVSPSIGDEARTVPGCIQYAKGWVYGPDEEIGEDWAIPCWMCPEGRAMEAGTR